MTGHVQWMRDFLKYLEYGRWLSEPMKFQGKEALEHAMTMVWFAPPAVFGPVVQSGKRGLFGSPHRMGVADTLSRTQLLELGGEWPIHILDAAAITRPMWDMCVDGVRFRAVVTRAVWAALLNTLFPDSKCIASSGAVR